MKLLSLLYELSNDLLDLNTQRVINKYVNENEIDSRFPKLDVKDSSLKYTGKALRIVPLPQSKIKQILAGGTLTLKQPSILSWSKSRKGLINFIYNIAGDTDKDKFHNAIVIKSNIKEKDCIIDITAYAKKYPKNIHSGHTSYIDEEEVITRPFLSNISKKDLDGYYMYGQGYKI